MEVGLDHGQETRDVAPFVEHRELLAVALWHVDTKIRERKRGALLFLDEHPGRGLEAVVGELHALRAEIPSRPGVDALVVEGGVVDLALRRVALAVLAVGRGQAVLEAVGIAEHAGEALLAARRGVPAAARLQLQRLGAALARDEVHHAAQRARPVQHRARAAHHLDALHHRGIQAERRADFPVVGDLLAVEQDRGAPRFLAADAHALQSGLSAVGHLHAGHAAHHVGESVGRGARELLAVDHADGLAGVEHDARRAPRGDDDFLQHVAAFAGAGRRPGGGSAGARRRGPQGPVPSWSASQGIPDICVPLGVRAWRVFAERPRGAGVVGAWHGLVVSRGVVNRGAHLQGITPARRARPGVVMRGVPTRASARLRVRPAAVLAAAIRSPRPSVPRARRG